MYRGITKQHKMTVHEFLSFMRRNCQNGCDKCYLRDKRIELAIQKKLCVFSNFDKLSDKSMVFILQQIKQI